MTQTPDICRGHHGGNECSEAANDAIHSAKAAIRERVWRWLAGREHGGTCDEAEQELGLGHQTASARLTELLQRGLAARSGEKRATRSGRSAAVIVARRAE